MTGTYALCDAHGAVVDTAARGKAGGGGAVIICFEMSKTISIKFTI